MEKPTIKLEDNILTIVLRLETPAAAAAQSTEDKILTVAEAAQYLRLSKARTYAMIQRREIPYIKLGEKNVRVRKSALEQWLNEQTQPAQK